MNEAAIAKIMQIPGQTTVEEIRFLIHLAGIAPQGGHIVELGTYHGRTAAALSRGARAQEVATIDDYSCREGTGMAPTPESVGEHLATLGCKARVVCGDSRKVPVGIGAVSLLYVDSEHTKAQFDAEMTAWLPAVVPGGIVACHDYGSPTWLEMTGVIMAWLGGWQRIGLVRRLIAFRRGAA